MSPTQWQCSPVRNIEILTVSFFNNPLFKLFHLLTWAMTARAVPDICFVIVMPELYCGMYLLG